MAITQTGAMLQRSSFECTGFSAHFEEHSRRGRRSRTIRGQLGCGRGRDARYGSRMRRGMGWCVPRWKFLTGCRPHMPKASTHTWTARCADALLERCRTSRCRCDTFECTRAGAQNVYHCCTTLVDDEPDAGTFDYNTINMPVFFCNTVAHYLFIHQLFTDAPRYFARGRRPSIAYGVLDREGHAR